MRSATKRSGDDSIVWMLIVVSSVRFDYDFVQCRVSGYAEDREDAICIGSLFLWERSN